MIEDGILIQPIDNVHIELITYNIFDPTVMIELPKSFDIILHDCETGYDVVKQIHKGITNLQKQTNIYNIYPTYCHIDNYNDIMLIQKTAIFAILAIIEQYTEDNFDRYINDLVHIQFLYDEFRFGIYPNPNNIIGVQLKLNTEEIVKSYCISKVSPNMINILRVYAGIAQLTHSVNIK